MWNWNKFFRDIIEGLTMNDDIPNYTGCFSLKSLFGLSFEEPGEPFDPESIRDYATTCGLVCIIETDPILAGQR